MKDTSTLETIPITNLQKILELIPECISIVAPDGHFLFLNPPALRMLEAKTLNDVEVSYYYDFASPAYKDKCVQNHERVCNGERLTWQFEIVGLKGSRRYVECRAVPFAVNDGIYSDFAIMEVIEEPANAHPGPIDTVLQGQRRALELIGKGADLHAVLDVMALTVEQQANGKLFAAISLLDAEGKHLLHGAAPSLPKLYNDAVDGIPIGPNVGACGTAAFTKKEVIVMDIKTDPLWKGFQDLALTAGLRAAWSIPIFSSQNELLATFAVYYPAPQRPGQQDRNAVEALAKTVGLIIEWYRNK